MAEVSRADEVPFAAYATLETSYTNPKLTSADLDGDGDLDLLASSGEDDAVTWFENTAGDGSAWTAHTLDSTSRDPRGIVAGDLDGDGDVDVAVAAFEDNAVRWYQNDPSLAVCGSEFCVGTVISLLGLNEMAVGDLDLDGDLDLVVTSETDERVIWLDNSVGDASTWSFQAFETQLGGASEVALADLDRDGDLDIVAQGRLPSAAGLVWLENSFPVLGSCAEAFCAQTLDSDPGLDLAVADLDGDGDPDLVRSGDGGALAWWNNTAGDGASFTETAITTSASTLEALEPMDLDADGDLDLLLSGGLWLDNSAGDASAWVERTLPTSADGFRYTTGDFDGDGDVDLAGAPWSEDSVGLFFNQSLHRSAVFDTARVALSGASDVDSVVAVDIDFDGDLDLISAGGNPDAVTFLENDGSPQDGGWIERTVGLANTFSVASADLDSDGDLDLISCNFASSNITWYENDGDPVLGTWTSYILTGFAGALDCRTVDIDGDGDLDVLANSRGGDLLSWFENNGTPTTVPWTRRDIGTDFDRPLEATSADLDGDGDVDVIGTASNDDAVAWWENDGAPGDGGWTRRDIDTALLEPAGAEPVDLDLDGDLDLVVAALEAPLTWYENDGTPADGGWTKRSIGSGRDAENVRAVDLDRDGDPDLLTTVRTNTGALLWWENDGTPGDGGWVERVVATGLNEPDYADAADLDGDGELDLLASIDGPNQILWYRNIGGQFALPTGDAVAEAVVNEGASDVALLRIDGVHRGRDGDDDAELATLELLFEAAVGDPLSGAELDALVAALRLYLDDGDGVFDPALDAEFYAAAPPFAVTAGLLTLTLVDGDPSARMAVGADVTWWLAADLDGASGSAVPDTFQATHLTSASSTAEMASTDIGLDLEGQDDVTSSAISINALPTLDAPIPNQSAVEGAVYGLDVSVFFSDSEGEPLAFAAAGLPSSLRLVDGEIRGTPSTLDLSASPYSVTVQASDDQDATVQAAFTLTLLDASDALFVDGFESADLSAWSASSP